MYLLTVNNDAKTKKGQQKGYLTGVIYMAPTDISGYNVCPMASQGCKAACLFTAGRGRFTQTQQARIRRTKLYFEDRPAFMVMLRKEIDALERKAARESLEPVVRLNGTSDIFGADYRQLMEDYSHLKFYDYTKVWNRFDKNLPDNYYLLFSRSENNEDKMFEILRRGYNVAVVFDSLPEYYHGYPVINGDKTDVRFLDPAGVIVGLNAKGEAKHDDSGFVVQTQMKQKEVA